MASAGGTSGKQRKPRVNRFHQKLGTLTHYQACGLLGDDGAKLIRDGGRLFEIQSDRDVFLGGDLFRVRVLDPSADGGVAIASMTLSSDRKKSLAINCDRCDTPCEHMGAALEYLLDAKSLLGLAMPPDEDVPLENLTVDELHQRALAERQKRANDERMTVRSMHSAKPWTDYVVTSAGSGRSYRVALRGLDKGQSFCTCPDFRTNRLGTCKHILHVIAKVQKRFSKAKLASRYVRKRLSLGNHGGTKGDPRRSHDHGGADREQEIHDGNGSLATAEVPASGPYGLR
ncbi:MAG: SWIM zinc finger family protein [Planctomycetota bacterium]